VASQPQPDRSRSHVDQGLPRHRRARPCGSRQDRISETLMRSSPSDPGMLRPSLRTIPRSSDLVVGAHGPSVTICRSVPTDGVPIGAKHFVSGRSAIQLTSLAGTRPQGWALNANLTDLLNVAYGRVAEVTWPARPGDASAEELVAGWRRRPLRRAPQRHLGGDRLRPGRHRHRGAAAWRRRWRLGSSGARALTPPARAGRAR
jgi:hypothetical protein